MAGTGASPASALPALPAAAASPGVPGSRGCRQPAGALAWGRGRCARAAADGRAAARRSRRACTRTTPRAWRASSGATRRWLRILRRWRWRPRYWTPPPAAWPGSTLRRAARPRPAGASRGPAGGRERRTRLPARWASAEPRAAGASCSGARARRARGRRPWTRVLQPRNQKFSCNPKPAPCTPKPARAQALASLRAQPGSPFHIRPCRFTLTLHFVP